MKFTDIENKQNDFLLLNPVVIKDQNEYSCPKPLDISLYDQLKQQIDREINRAITSEIDIRTTIENMVMPNLDSLIAGLESEISNRTYQIDNLKSQAVGIEYFGTGHSIDYVDIYFAPIGSKMLKSYKIQAATTQHAGVMSVEDKEKLDTTESVIEVLWDNKVNLSNMNTFINTGIYIIKGEHTRENDNLPIANTGGGHTFNARLFVLNSSISGDGKNTDKCVTQILTFSNRVGGDGNVYIRTGRGASEDNLTWEAWSTLLKNKNVGAVTTLDDLIDNGVYSGVFVGDYSKPHETFILVVINDYQVAVTDRHVSQFYYSVDSYTGETTYNTRTGSGTPIKWSDWHYINYLKIQKDIEDLVFGHVNLSISELIGTAPETLDTIHEIASWIVNDKTGAAAMAQQIESLGNDIVSVYELINEEMNNRTGAINNVKSKAIGVERFGVSNHENDVDIVFAPVDSNAMTAVTIPAATTEKAGVMSAEDKREIAENKTAIEEEIERATKAETNAIEQGRRAALINMYSLIGASYDKSTDTFTFNTVTGLSWSEMGATYVNLDLAYRLHLPRAAQSISNLRVVSPIQNVLTSPSIKIQGLYTFYATAIELFALCKLSSTSYDTYLNETRTDLVPVCTYVYDTFRLCSKLKVVFPINLKGCTSITYSSFAGCVALEELRLLNLPLSLNLDNSPLISKASILYIIANAAPNSAITITLHPDAYARLAEDADIVAALTAQPLITLVSA